MLNGVCWLRAQRKGLTLQRLELGLQLGDALTLPHVLRLTTQSLLSPAAEMPPHWRWAAMCQDRTYVAIAKKITGSITR
jgi:hypothetical protein